MAIHGYNLRNAKGTPTTTPISKLNASVVTKIQAPSYQLQLKHVIGTTAKSPPGLATCAARNTFAYSAGSVAVLAFVNESGDVSRRYYRARPAVVPINPPDSFYATPNTTPTRMRQSLITPRREREQLTPNRTLLEDENARTWTARERIKSVSCVALSSNGRYLAVGETGYNPRILLYSTSTEASTELPLSVINEHSLGVKCIAFSPDSRYLATLGESNDGFLFIWNVNPKTGVVQLCATNKCTTNVCHMAWCGQNLITVGTRHVKVWPLPWSEKGSPRKSRLRDIVEASPTTRPVPLSGRNCLLGDLVDVTFTCVATVSDDLAVVGTDIDTLCLIDLSKNPTELKPLLDRCHGGIVAVRSGQQRLVWAGMDEGLHTADLQDLLVQRQSQMAKPVLSRSSRRETASRVTPRSTLRQSLGLSQLSQTGTTALGCMSRHNIYIDTDSNLVISPAATDQCSSKPKHLCSHNEPVIRGVQALPHTSGLGAFFTWSKTGEVRFWNSDSTLRRVEQIELGDATELEDAASNELIVLRLFNDILVSGDRYGVLKLTQCNSWNTVHIARAHSAEVSDIAMTSESKYVATCSRDRMVQVFSLSDAKLDLLQTSDDHIAAVTQVCFNNNGDTLLSSSADRTIVVRGKVSRQNADDLLTAFLQLRIITVKASPLAMVLAPSTDCIMYVSTLDRSISKIDYSSGTILDTFKTADTDADDHAVLNDIRIVDSRTSSASQSLLIACSSTDKSVRLYDLQKQTLISKESSHTQGVSAVTLLDNNLPDQQTDSLTEFVSVGLDGTIMLWAAVPTTSHAVTPNIELSRAEAEPMYGTNNTPAKNSPATLPPLRKVLTKLDLAEFARDLPATSPRSRAQSPVAKLRRKGSKLALTSSVLESGENIPPSQQRRASADDRVKSERRSPSPPAYATRRQKAPLVRGEISKDFYTRQSEWLKKSPSPEPNNTPSTIKPEQVANKAKLRRPPSVPSDLRNRNGVPDRRASTTVGPSDASATSIATEQVVRALQTYHKRLQVAPEPFDLTHVESELEALLSLVKAKKAGSKRVVPEIPQRSTSTTQRLKLRRQNTTIPTMTAPATQSYESLSSSTTSPTTFSDGSRLSGIAEADTTSKTLANVDVVTHLFRQVSLAGT